MATREIDELRAEIKALRQEIIALRADETSSESQNAKANNGDGGEATKAQEPFRTFAQEISALTRELENDVVGHPILGVSAALVLGILIGRVLPRASE